MSQMIKIYGTLKQLVLQTVAMFIKTRIRRVGSLIHVLGCRIRNQYVKNTYNKNATIIINSVHWLYLITVETAGSWLTHWKKCISLPISQMIKCTLKKKMLHNIRLISMKMYRFQCLTTKQSTWSMHLIAILIWYVEVSQFHRKALKKKKHFDRVNIQVCVFQESSCSLFVTMYCLPLYSNLVGGRVFNTQGFGSYSFIVQWGKNCNPSLLLSRIFSCH